MDTTTKGSRTKYRLAEAMKECMKTTPVDNITVTQLTELCGVTRQTFYRNFIDKYDLINWYFDILLHKSFEHMGSGKNIYESLVKKFIYIREWGGELRKHFSKERCSQTAMPFFAVFPLYFGLFLSPVQNQMHR